MVRLAKTTKILLGVAIGLGTATVGTAAYYFSSAPETAKITVPSFVGKTKSDVESWMTENSVSSDQCTFDYTYDEEKDQDVVLSQSIEADSVLGSEEVLEITLSNGPDPDKEFKMPDFTGKKQAAVEQWFEDHKFTAVSYAFESDDKVEKGVFLKASADAGTTMKRSDELTITFSSGSDSDEKTEVTVPDFSSYSRKNMQAWASQNGITLTIAAQASDTVASGGFLSQSVKAGTKVKSGSSITVTLSSGKAIKIGNYEFEVIGVTEASQMTSNTSYMPFSTLNTRVNNYESVDQILGYAREDVDPDALAEKTDGYLRSLYNIDEEEGNGYVYVYTMASVTRQLDSTMMSFQLLMTAVASISLSTVEPCFSSIFLVVELYEPPSTSDSKSVLSAFPLMS